MEGIDVLSLSFVGQILTNGNYVYQIEIIY